jgi:hypothetical protein
VRRCPAGNGGRGAPCAPSMAASTASRRVAVAARRSEQHLPRRARLRIEGDDSAAPPCALSHVPELDEGMPDVAGYAVGDGELALARPQRQRIGAGPQADAVAAAASSTWPAATRSPSASSAGRRRTSAATGGISCTPPPAARTVRREPPGGQLGAVDDLVATHPQGPARSGASAAPPRAAPGHRATRPARPRAQPGELACAAARWAAVSASHSVPQVSRSIRLQPGHEPTRPSTAVRGRARPGRRR